MQDETIKSLRNQLDDSSSKLASCEGKVTKEQAAVARLQQHASEAEKEEAQKAKTRSQKISQLQEMLQAKQSELGGDKKRLLS